MRVFARISQALAVLALMAPSAAWSQSPAAGHPSMKTAQAQKPKRSWFRGSDNCAECQRIAFQAKHGVSVPPPPPLPGAVSQGHVCAQCGGGREVLTTTGPMTMVQGQPATGGYMYAPGESPGYATTDGGPAPVGEFRPMMASVPPQGGPMAAGPRDSSVEMSSYSPTPVIPVGANRPMVFSHLFGFSEIGRDWREARANRKGSSHAAIPYGPSNGPVADLPARMVYGR